MLTAPLAGEEAMYIPATQMDPQATLAGSRLVPAKLDCPHSRPGGGVDRADATRAGECRSQPALLGLLQHAATCWRRPWRRSVSKWRCWRDGGLALLLSAVGIFALVANIVAQKTREIGIRIALGSTIRQAMVHIGAPGVRASVLGLFLGLILCAGALRAMHSVLYGVGVYDVPTILAVVLVLGLVTLIATMVPTLRIAGIDPAKTLREE